MRLHETVDFTRVRDVQMMTETDRLNGLDLFYKLMHREPFPAEKAFAGSDDSIARDVEVRLLLRGLRPLGQLPHSGQPAASGFEDWQWDPEAP